MTDHVFRYKPGALFVDLGENECVVSAYRDGIAYLTFCFKRVTDGKLEKRSLPMRPNGPQGDIPFCWGFNRSGPNRWDVSPSILCWDSLPEDRRVEVWHRTPCVVGVPEEPWTTADCECR